MGPDPGSNQWPFTSAGWWPTNWATPVGTVSIICPFAPFSSISHMNETIWFLIFSTWLFLLSTIFSRAIHAVAKIMAHKYMKRCSTSLAIGKMEIKTRIRYYFTPVWKAVISKAGYKFWRGCGGKGPTLLYWWWECILVQPLWKTVWNLCKKFRIELPYDPGTTVLGIHPPI